MGLCGPDTLDVRDLDPALPRVELTAYRWADDGFELCITLPLGEPVPREQVRNRPMQSVLELAQSGLLGKQRGCAAKGQTSPNLHCSSSEVRVAPVTACYCPQALKRSCRASPRLDSPSGKTALLADLRHC